MQCRIEACATLPTPVDGSEQAQTKTAPESLMMSLGAKHTAKVLEPELAFLYILQILSSCPFKALSDKVGSNEFCASSRPMARGFS